MLWGANTFPTEFYFLQILFLFFVYFISVSNHIVKKIGDDFYFLLKLTLLRNVGHSALSRTHGESLATPLGIWGFTSRVWSFSLLFWIILFFNFILNVLCVVIVHLIITHTIMSLLPRLYLHKVRIENGVALTFDKLMLQCRHMKNSHSIWSIYHIWLWPNWEPLSFSNFRINLTVRTRFPGKFNSWTWTWCWCCIFVDLMRCDSISRIWSSDSLSIGCLRLIWRHLILSRLDAYAWFGGSGARDVLEVGALEESLYL